MNPQNTPTPDIDGPQPQNVPPAISFQNPALQPQGVNPVNSYPNSTSQPQFDQATMPAQPASQFSSYAPAPTVAAQYNPMLQQVAAKSAGSFNKPKLIMALVLVFVLTVASGGFALSQINKTQKSFSGNGGTNSWVPYTGASGNFSASFPTTPSVVPQSSQSQNGVSFTVNGVQWANTDTNYAVAYVTYPSTVTLPSGSTFMNDAVQAEAGLLTGGQLISSGNTTVSGYQAEKYEITGTKNGATAYSTGEVVLVNHVLYDIAATQYGGSQAPNAQDFLSSFKIG